MSGLIKLIWNECLRWPCRECGHYERHRWTCSKASRNELREHIEWLEERHRELSEDLQVVFQKSQDMARKVLEGYQELKELKHENNKLRKANEQLLKEAG